VLVGDSVNVSAKTTPLTHGSTTMVSTLANGTSVPALPASIGASEVAISDDGKVVAFTSDVPAEELVTDPLQTGHVTDNNTGKAGGGISSGLDVFVYDSRVPSPLGPIISLVSWNSSHTGTGDWPSDAPVMAPLGIGLVFESAATDLVGSSNVVIGSHHLYAWVPLLSPLTSVFPDRSRVAATRRVRLHQPRSVDLLAAHAHGRVQGFRFEHHARGLPPRRRRPGVRGRRVVGHDDAREHRHARPRRGRWRRRANDRRGRANRRFHVLGK
jgi:hypothetical protein